MVPTLLSKNKDFAILLEIVAKSDIRFSIKILLYSILKLVSVGVQVSVWC